MSIKLEKIKIMKNKNLLIRSRENMVHTSIHSTNETNMLTAPQQSSRRQSTKKRSKLTKSLKLAAMVFWVCMSGVSLAQVNVTTDTDWYTGNLPSVAYAGGVTVSPNIKLTITGITLNMNASSPITLGIGSELEIVNCVLQPVGTTWDGIVAHGDGVSEQYSTFPDPTVKNSTPAWEGVLASTQTSVKLINTSLINAKIGVRSNSGAVVQTRGGDFTNCEVGVKLNTYISKTQPKVNACYFQGTTFEWNNSFNSINGLFQPASLRGIWLDGVTSINIGGCIFTNSNTTSFCTNERATGIYAYNSSFTAEYEGDQFCDDDLCDSEPNAAKNCLLSGALNPCQFLKLSYGVDFVGLNNMAGFNNNSMVSRHNTFTDNFGSIRNNYSNSMGLYDNTFSTTRSVLNSNFTNTGCSGSTAYYAGSVIYDVYTENAHQLRILDNVFTSDKNFVEHLKIDNSGRSGDYSLIKENDFTSTTAGYDQYENARGILFQRNNQGLDIECNTFVNQGVDIYNTSTSTLDLQPSDGSVVGNTPSSNLTNRLHIQNDGSSFNYRVINGGLLVIAAYGGTNPVNPSQNGSIVRDCTVECLDAIGKLAINEYQSRDEFIVFPNPAATQFNINAKSLNFTGGALLDIIDITGKSVLTMDYLINAPQAVDISNLTSGLYTVKITSIDGSSIGYSKLSVQR
jgi:hypothetical protein